MGSVVALTRYGLVVPCRSPFTGRESRHAPRPRYDRIRRQARVRGDAADSAVALAAAGGAAGTDVGSSTRTTRRSARSRSAAGSSSSRSSLADRACRGLSPRRGGITASRWRRRVGTGSPRIVVPRGNSVEKNAAMRALAWSSSSTGTISRPRGSTPGHRSPLSAAVPRSVVPPMVGAGSGDVRAGVLPGGRRPPYGVRADRPRLGHLRDDRGARRARPRDRGRRRRLVARAGLCRSPSSPGGRSIAGDDQAQRWDGLPDPGAAGASRSSASTSTGSSRSPTRRSPRRSA